MTWAELRPAFAKRRYPCAERASAHGLIARNNQDVRTPQEYQEGHIPESKNVPLQQLDNIASVAKNKDIPLFVYCYSGSRSRQATGILQRMGYSKVNNIGGIAAYSGKVEK